MRHYFQHVGNPGYGAIGEEVPPPYVQEESAPLQLHQEALQPDRNLVALPEDEPPVENLYANLDQVAILTHIRYGLKRKTSRSGSSSLNFYHLYNLRDNFLFEPKFVMA